MSHKTPGDNDHKFNFRDLLKDPNKKIGEAENIPAKLFRKMLIHNGVLPSEWERATERYYKRIHLDNVAAINTEKSNLLKALINPNLSWYRFITALEILGFEEYEFVVKAKTSNGERTYIEKLRNRRHNIVNRPEEDDEE